MKAGDIFIFGYWPRESNLGFRGDCGTNTIYATETVSSLDTVNRNPCPISRKKIEILSDFGKIDKKFP